MECKHCSVPVVDYSELFFFCKNEKEVHLSVKPERMEFLLAKKTLKIESEGPKKVRIKCNICLHNLGVEIPFGPDGVKFYAFAYDKVKLRGKAFSPTQRWWKMLSEFKQIDTRDMESFFNVFNSGGQRIEKNEPVSNNVTIKFPALENLTDFEWLTVSLDKKPRDYQIEAFIESLQRNVIVVIKTGAGKTLIASMFLAKMCNLNPSKMGVMIVDRVPLAFQQGDAIRKDTNLRVVSICGENNTAYKVQQLNKGVFDVLVITAGALYEMLSVKKSVGVELFCAVVFDECHHVSGNHTYVNVLGLFTEQASNQQPRIMGLTASPINCKTLSLAESRLQKFIKKFPPNTKIFSPTLPKPDLRSEEIDIRRTHIQDRFIDACLKDFREISVIISNMVGIKDLPYLADDLHNIHSVVGDLRSLDIEYNDNYSDLRSHINDTMLLINAMQASSMMGVSYGCEKLKENVKLQNVVLEFQNYNELSPRLEHLHETLKSFHKSKTLIFVSTRSLARELTSHLQQVFSKLKVNRIVGHNGYDGMDWEGEQEERIKQFSGDECDLLVATSVLEEGIDITACDLVVCFTGVKSLIKFIQAKGRARQKGSRFIVYQDVTEKKYNQNLQLQEEILNAVLREHQNTSSLSTVISKDIKERIEREMLSGELPSLKNESSQLFENEDTSDFSFTIYVDLSTLLQIKPSSIKEALLEILEEVQVFKLKRLEIVPHQLDQRTMERSMFSENTLTFVVGVQNLAGRSVMETYRQFCQSFMYHLELDDGKCYAWSRIKQPMKREVLVERDSNEESIEFISFKLGYLVNRTNYVVGYNSPEFDILCASFSKSDIVISWDINFGSKKMKLVIPKCSIASFVLLSYQHDYFLMGFCLSYCPFLAVEEEQLDGTVSTFRQTTLENYELIDALGRYPLLLMKFNNRNVNNITHILESMMPCPYFNVNLHEVKEDIVLGVSSMTKLQDILWSLKCLEDSRRMLYLPNTPLRMSNIYMSKLDDKELIEKTIHKTCLVSTNQSYFCRIERLLDKGYTAYKKIPETKRWLLDDVVPLNHYLVKRLIVTPLREVALPAVPVASNRILRRLSNTIYSLIIVSFRDEDLSKIVDGNLLKRFKKCVAQGVIINGVTYRFFLSTGSQLREHKAYYIAASHEKILHLRKEIIPVPTDFSSVAKYLSRLGIYGTTDNVVGPKPAESFNVIEDLSAENGDLVTDGAGKISPNMAEEIAMVLGKDNVPSAFQIRYSGVKGILVVTHNGDPDLQGKQFAVRKDSMIKFHNQDTEFCVGNASCNYEFTLNRELINLLCSIPYNWNLENVLLQYQEEALSNYSEMFNDTCKAQKELSCYLTSTYVNMLFSCGMEILDEKYWINILQGIYRLRSRAIRTKTSIPVSQSSLLMGVPDPVGVLNEGEVFVQLSSLSSLSSRLIEGNVLVFRNPCLHPGDIRTVTAIKKDELMYLVDVVVFPVKDCKSSLATSCSGGDLDGDLYGVIWDQNLVPPKDTMYAPCNYTEFAIPQTPTPELDVTNPDCLAEYYEKFMSNDCLGRIAHRHMALCDKLEKGARDPLAVEFAKSQAQAVDFPKTGIIPEVPKDATDGTFPDFMEKSITKTRISRKILGKLYRRCCSLTYDFEVCLYQGRDMLMNRNLVIEGNEKYLEDAYNVYIAYVNDIEMLMRRFELKVEADIILGDATMRWSRHFEADKGKATKAIKAIYDCIVQKYRKIFFSDVNDQESIRKKASAWYRVVNDCELEMTPNRQLEAKTFRSFPWIVTDILCDIRRETNQELPSRRLVTIGESSLEYFKKNSKQLLINVTEKLKMMKKIESTIEKYMERSYGINKAFMVCAYGSTSIFVCEPDSDIDVCVLPKPKVFKNSIIVPNEKNFRELPLISQQRHFLRLVISPAANTIASQKREIFDGHVPHIKCSFGNDGETQLHCDISMNEIGYRKTLYIHHLFAMRQFGPCYLPLFWILVRWARVAGIVRSMFNPSKLIDTADFYALIIHVLELPAVENVVLKQPDRWSNIKYLCQQVDKLQLDGFYELGKMLFDFFRKLSNMRGNLEIAWPDPEIKDLACIDESSMSTISLFAAKAYHALSATRDVNVVLNYFLVTSKAKIQLNRVLPLSLSYAIGKSRQFHAARLSEITGALVTIDIKKGKRNLVIHGEGNRISIGNLLNEIQSLQQTNKALMLGKVLHKASRYFMEGSSIIFAKGSQDGASPLHFEDSFGTYELPHHARRRSSVYMQTEADKDDNIWREAAKVRFCQHIIRQLRNFPRDGSTDALESLLNNMDVTCRFGCFYLVDIDSYLPEAQNSIELRELELTVEKGRHTRKAWKRSEFRENYTEYGVDDTTTETPRFEMSRMKPMGSPSVKFTKKVKKELYKHKKTKRGIASAFTPGLLRNNTNDQCARNTLVQAYHKVLKNCGFRDGQSSNREVSPTWKVSLNPSTSYEVQLNLNGHFEVTKMAERSLHWVHGTILDGRKQRFNNDNNIRTNADLRFQISTQDDVKEGSELHRSVLPGGVLPFSVNDNDGRIIINDFAKRKGKRNFVSMIRNVQSLEVFTNGEVDACLVNGNIYFGDGMALKRPFHELTLYFDSTPFTTAIREGFIENDEFEEHLRRLFDISLRMQEEIDNVLRNA